MHGVVQQAKGPLEAQLAPGSEARAARQVTEPTGSGALIVMPTYNERESLATVVAEVLLHAPGVHVLVVDDNSPDGTGELAETLANADARVHVMRRGQKLGLGSAYVAGFGWGLQRHYRQFLEMDADLSHDPAELYRFFDALAAGADVVVGSRNVAGGRIVGWGLGRLLLSKGGSAYARAVLGISVRDLTTGYKAYTRGALERLGLSELHSDGYAFQVETTFRALRCGLGVVEVPITFVDRRVGQSKMDRRILLEAVVVVWRLRWELSADNRLP